MYFQRLNKFRNMEKTKNTLNDDIQSSNMLCSSSRCFISEDSTENDVLQCRKCKRLVHYVCSDLPDYQIQICLNFKTRSFQCRNCVQISENLKDRINSNHETKIGELRKEIVACENIIKAQEMQIKENSPKNVSIGDNNVNEFIEKFDKRMEQLEQKLDNITHIEKTKVSYAQVAKKHIEAQSKKFDKIIKRENKEEQWIQSTSCNLVIHGFDDIYGDSEEECMNGDKEYVEQDLLSKVMGLDLEIVSTHRIGILTKEREQKEKYRPMVVRFKTE